MIKVPLLAFASANTCFFWLSFASKSSYFPHLLHFLLSKAIPALFSYLQDSNIELIYFCAALLAFTSTELSADISKKIVLIISLMSLNIINESCATICSRRTLSSIWLRLCSITKLILLLKNSSKLEMYPANFSSLSLTSSPGCDCSFLSLI